MPQDPISHFQNAALRMFVDTLKVRRAIAYRIDQNNNLIGFQTYHLPAAMHRDYLQHFQHLDPLHPTQVDVDRTTVITTGDCLSPEHQQRHPYCLDFMRPWQVRETTELFLQTQDVRLGFSLFQEMESLGGVRFSAAQLSGLQQFMQFSLNQMVTAEQAGNLQHFGERFALTQREQQIVEQVLAGQNRKQIAHYLGCSLSTVKTHLEHIFRKTDTHSQAELCACFRHQRC